MQQKALIIPAKQAPFSLQERPIPTPGQGQLLVKIHTTALNPVDWKIQKLGWFIEDFPAIIGGDIAGVVEQVGEGVTGFAKGDRVFFQGNFAPDLAGYQQYVLANAPFTAKIPDSLSFDEASTIPLALAAPIVGFYMTQPHGAGLKEPFGDGNGKGAYAGQPAVIIGGGSSVGQYAIQLAKLSGFSPIVTVASVKHTAHLKSLGATHVLDRGTSSSVIRDVMPQYTGSKPVKFVFDAVSIGSTQKLAQELTAPGGSTVIVLPAEIEKVEGKEFFHALGIFAFPHQQALGQRFYASLTKLVADGHIKPTRLEVVPKGLNGIVPALERLELDKVSGQKLVIHPQETA